MEIKAQLMKPYDESQRIEFIVEQNHRNGYEIVETETSLDAMGYTEEELEEIERERIANLTQTRANTWRALIQARMFTKANVVEIIEALPERTPEEIMAKEIAKIDVEDVEDFHRGHELVNLIGNHLGITSENLDNFFETGDYYYLTEGAQPEPEVEEIPAEEPEVKPEPENKSEELEEKEIEE